MTQRPSLNPGAALLCASALLYGLGQSIATGASTVQDWPQWRCPTQNGVGTGEPPTEWSETKNVKWKTKIPGEGTSTPIISGDKVFILSAINTGKRGDGRGNPSTSTGQPGPRGGPPGEFRGPGGGGPPPGGGGGRGGPGGGPGNMLCRQMFESGDKNNDQKLTQNEFIALADAWFDKLDPGKSSKVDQDKFVEGLATILPPPPEGVPGGPGGRGGGPARFVGPALFAMADSNKDGSLTRDEFKSAFAKWFGDWVSEKTGALTEEKFRDSLNATLHRRQFGGGPGGRGGRGGPGGGGFGGGMGGQTPTEIHQFAILCLDRQTGNILWQKIAHEEIPHEGHHPTEGNFAPSSPVTDGKYLFADFGSRGLYCYDFEGNLKWKKELGRMQIKNSFGEGSSPALFGHTLVLNRDQEGGSYIIALDTETGQELWRTSRDEETTWATPLIVQYQGKAQVVTSGTKKIRSYDLATGKMIWECAGLTPNVIPSPVADNGMVYAISGFRGSSLLAIKLGRTGDLTGTDAIAWQYNKSTPYVPSPMLYGNKLYFLANNNGVLSCFDVTTGKPFYTEERLQDIRGVYASPVGAAGKVYLVGREGTTVVIKNSDKFEVLATNQLDDKSDASPAIAGRELFLRGKEYVYCLAEK